MMVMKFGGTSVSSLKNIKHIHAIALAKKEPFIMVVSALSGTTDSLEQIAVAALAGNYQDLVETLKSKHFILVYQLLQPAHQTEVVVYIQQQFNLLENICAGIYILSELSDKIKARILSFGEQLSAFIIHKFLIQEGLEIELLDSRPLIKANHNYLNAEINLEKTEALISTYVKQKNYITGGFIATNNRNETVLLGRGGSDYTAALYAYALNASHLEIWSDVNGMQTANPKLVSNPMLIEKLSYKEAFELAYFGAKVLYPPSIRPVRDKNIPLYLKNTLNPEQAGTFISINGSDIEQTIQGVSSLANISVLNITGVGLVQKKGTARRVFQAIEEAEVNVILITQSCSEQSICLGISNSDATRAKLSLNKAFKYELSVGLMNPLEISNDYAIVAVIGDNMKNRVGLSGQVFRALGENGINITAIAQGSSERNISIIVNKIDEAKAVHVLHEKFFEKTIKQIHLFIAGVGNVGSAFLKVIEKQHAHLLESHQINIKIIGLANSKKMLFSDEGLNATDLKNFKDKGLNYQSFDDFIRKAKSYNLRNSIFIDNTASEIVSHTYEYLLQNSISVVTCNKIACSGPFKQYKYLLHLAKEHNAHFKYETSVGAALPIIKTIQDLILSGDEIIKIQAVLSGSLNFIFNEYNGLKPFSEIVLKAKNEGYTEPNPLIDLSGLDVMRKILILSREAGFEKEMSDISFKGFLPDSCNDASNLEKFFKELLKNEAHFKEIYQHALSKGCKLKVVATLENGKLSVALNEISSDSSLYNLEGKDNVVALHTERYFNEPMIIKGAGAGAVVTASGVFSDLMYIVNR